MNHYNAAWRFLRRSLRRALRRTLRRFARRAKSGTRVALLAGGMLFSVACQRPADVPIVVTEVMMVEGQEIIVTRVVLQTLQVPVTNDLIENARPVTLDVSFTGEWQPLDPQRTSYDPQRAINQDAVDFIENLFAGLTSFNHQSNTVEPELAREWVVSGDGRIWTFSLRDDIFWVRPVASSRPRDGLAASVQAIRPVVAADVVYAIHRACDRRTHTSDVFILYIIEGCQHVNNLEAPSAADLDRIGVREVSDTELQISLTRPAAHFLTISSLPMLRPVPADLVTELGDRWTDPENIITSGPFILGPDSLGGTRTLLQRNPFWPIFFSGNVEVVNIWHVDDEMDAFQLWQSRSIDFSPLPAAERANMLRNSPSRVELVPTQAVFYLSYNFSSPVFRETEVRQAFGAAIDRERLIREVYGGRAWPMRHFSPPGVFGAPPIDEIGAGYSPDYARHQMAASSLRHCRFMPPIRYLVSSSDLALQQAELLRIMWREELGCREDQIMIEQVQFGTLLANTRRDAGALRPDLWDLGWASYYPDANNWLNDVLHCTESENRQTRPCSEVDEMIRQAASEAAPELRQQLYRQIEGAFFAPGGLEPLSPLYVRAQYVLRHHWLTFRPALFGGEQYDTYHIDSDIKDLERTR